MKAHQSAVINFFKTLSPGRLLDAGSGGDALAGALRERFQVVSLDLFEIPKEPKSFVRADLNRGLPFLDRTFDYILCSESLQYLENHTGLFREFARLLKGGGSLVLSFPNVLSASSRLYFLQRGYYPSFKPARTVDLKKGWDAVVYNPVSYVEVSELAKKNGMRVIDVRASRMKTSNLLLYPILKGLYSLGLLFDGKGEKADLLRHLSSKEVLLGDHLIVRMEKTC